MRSGLEPHPRPVGHPLSINGEGEDARVAGVYGFGEGEDARVAGVMYLARGKTPALRAFMDLARWMDICQRQM